jgi:lipid A 3-O-deacylase
MNKFAFLAAFCGLLVTLAAPVKAQDSVDPSYISFGAGVWDITQDDDMATDFRVEYRHGALLFWKIKPWAGVEATTDGSLWGGVGILADFKICENVYITPSFGAGLYTDGGSDKDLDYPLEFRSQLEAGYEFANTQRLGVSFGHISNADLGDDNPGTEILNVYYHVPVGSLF